jgi:hypothetical protein
VFPYRDENATQRPAYVTIGIISLCVFIWIFVQGAGLGRALPETVCNLGFDSGGDHRRTVSGCRVSNGKWARMHY